MSITASPVMTFANILTYYRIITAPVLLVLVIAGYLTAFKWMLGISFLTDAVDGILARRLKNTSVSGSRLDSMGDDLTFAVALIGLAVTRPEFLLLHWRIIAVLAALYLAQLISAIKKYRRITSFHTYLAKVAAVMQAAFLLSTFFFAEICYPLFFAACAFTALDLIEEIVLVFAIPKWETDVKGLYWVWKNRKPL